MKGEGRTDVYVSVCTQQRQSFDELFDMTIHVSESLYAVTDRSRVLSDRRAMMMRQEEGGDTMYVRYGTRRKVR